MALPDREMQRALDNFAGRMRPMQGVVRARTRTLLLPFGDGVTDLATTTPPVMVPVAWDLTVIEWRIITNAAGTVSVDVLHSSWLGFPGGFATMVGTAYPATDAGTQKGTGDTRLWTLTLIRETDLLQVQVHAATAGVSNGLLQLKCREASQ